MIPTVNHSLGGSYSPWFLSTSFLDLVLLGFVVSKPSIVESVYISFESIHPFTPLFNRYLPSTYSVH